MFQDGNYLFTEPGKSATVATMSGGIFTANGREWQAMPNPQNETLATIDLVHESDVPVIIKKFGPVWRSAGNTHILAQLA